MKIPPYFEGFPPQFIIGINLILLHLSLTKSIFMRRITLLLISVAILFIGCNKDESIEDNNTPEIELNATSLHTQPEEKIIIKAILSDPIALSSVNIYNQNWYLNKTIDLSKDSLGNSITEYELNYAFAVPDTTGYEEVLVITVTNVGGKTNTVNLPVIMDGDIKAPEIDVDGQVDDGATITADEGDQFEIYIYVSDDIKLGYFVISEPTLGLYDSIYEFSNVKEFEYENYDTEIPYKNADYDFSVVCADSAGNITTKNLDVTVKVNSK